MKKTLKISFHILFLLFLCNCGAITEVGDNSQPVPVKYDCSRVVFSATIFEDGTWSLKLHSDNLNFEKVTLKIKLLHKGKIYPEDFTFGPFNLENWSDLYFPEKNSKYFGYKLFPFDPLEEVCFKCRLEGPGIVDKCRKPLEIQICHKLPASET